MIESELIWSLCLVHHSSACVVSLPGSARAARLDPRRELVDCGRGGREREEAGGQPQALQHRGIRGRAAPAAAVVVCAILYLVQYPGTI